MLDPEAGPTGYVYQSEWLNIHGRRVTVIVYND
jgi:hypothetical protein